MMPWGSVAAMSLFGWRFAPRRPLKGENLVLILDITAAVIEGVFALVFLGFLWQFGEDALSGVTQIDYFKGRQTRPARTKMEAMRRICGDGPVFCWICPTDAFPDDLELEEGPGIRGVTVT
jgi:hypothetical protein